MPKAKNSWNVCNSNQFKQVSYLKINSSEVILNQGITKKNGADIGVGILEVVPSQSRGELDWE